MNAPLDPRVNPFRPDLAAETLRGSVEAERFVLPALFQVQAARAPIAAKPDRMANMASELLYGELFDVYEEKDGWMWGQARRDHYVGYVQADALGGQVRQTTHTVSVPSSFVFPGPDVKQPPVTRLFMQAEIPVSGAAGSFALLPDGGHVPLGHIVEHGQTANDFVAVAKRFRGVPYLWGGRTTAGIDCSGLIQTALTRTGRTCPRDSDMQEAQLGQTVGDGDDLTVLRTGDLVFWRGHVGIMVDAENLLHANGHHMMAAIEPVSRAVSRIAENHGPVSAIKRLPDY